MLERRATRVPSAIAELFVKNIGIDPFSQLSLIAKKQQLTPVGTMHTNVLQNHLRHTPRYLYFVCHLRSKPVDNLLTQKE